MNVAEIFRQRAFMEPEVFIGGTGDLIIRQEWPSFDSSETYTLIRIPMSEAEALADAIRAAVHGVKR